MPAMWITMMPEHSYLGVSGDGIIKNHRYHGENPGFLEIKCSFSLDKIQVTQKTIADIATEQGKVNAVFYSSSSFQWSLPRESLTKQFFSFLLDN